MDWKELQENTKAITGYAAQKINERQQTATQNAMLAFASVFGLFAALLFLLKIKA